MPFFQTQLPFERAVYGESDPAADLLPAARTVKSTTGKSRWNNTSRHPGFWLPIIP
jgi:hypothetical protein